MGGCHSAVNAKADQSNSKRSSAGDFAAFIRKLSSGAASAAAYFSESRELHQIPGRLFANGGSRIASLHTQQGKKGINQDAMLVWKNFGAGRGRNATICGVFDGHGPYGHMVAKRVRDVLPILVSLQWEEIEPQNDQTFASGTGDSQGIRRFDGFKTDGDDDSYESTELEDNEAVPDTHVVLKKSMLKACKLMDDELKSHPRIDCFCSGTTAVILVVEGHNLIIGNVGDSRAVLATRDNDSNALAALQLTVDLKPDLPRETARILKCKGRVFAMADEPEVARLWLPNSDSPGLAMARAFGDFCLKDFGLISVPDVHYRRITDRDEFVILASDGVWDVLSNQEAVDVVAASPSRGMASRALVECATRAWRLKYPTSKIDDCTVVCLFLDNLPRAYSLRALNDPATASEDNTKAEVSDKPCAISPNAAALPVPSGARTLRALNDPATASEDNTKAELSDKPCANSPNAAVLPVPSGAQTLRAALNDPATTSKDNTKAEVSDKPCANSPNAAALPVPSGTTNDSDEIVPVAEEPEKPMQRSFSQSSRTLAEYLASESEDEEWSALEGLCRANSLISLPRFLPSLRRSTNRGKCL